MYLFLVGFLQRECEPVFNLFRESTVIEADQLKIELRTYQYFFHFFLKLVCFRKGFRIPYFICSGEDKLTRMFQMLSEYTKDHESIIRTYSSLQLRNLFKALKTISNQTSLDIQEIRDKKKGCLGLRQSLIM